MQPMRLANRLLTFNVMFVIGMVYVFGHCVIDLYSSPDREDILAGLAAECKQVSGSYNGLGSKEAVDRLYRIDSTIRESMRVSDVAVTALARDVVGKPLDLGNGIRIPRGTRVVYPTQAVHQDPDHYRDPLQFDAFRFSRPFEGISPQKGVDELGQNEENRLRLTTITPSFLAFGYGKHACPGRWFATQTMKQALAGIVQNYDIEITNRPSTRPVVLNMMVPPTGTQMRFRRKAKR
jgi:cytochrome P450